jgi:uncharacterized protein YndB with AHSA1/START domain
MPTQRTFKRRVRARMAKTGEAYTAARQQLLRKAERPAQSLATEGTTATTAGAVADAGPAVDFPTSEEAVLSATGRSYPSWFALLDEWGATARRHAEIAAWLAEEHGVAPWWRQSVTVAYERARGMRAVHQMPSGFTVGVTRTIATAPEVALAAFTDPVVRRRWLGDIDVSQRRTTAAGNVRFDWPDPPSRLVVYAGPKGAAKTLVSVSHERLADADTAAREKSAWKERLGALKALLEG